MRATPVSGASQLPLSGLRHLDEVCDQFEAAWRRGEQPPIEPYLKQISLARQKRLLRHLLLLDVEYRIAGGQSVAAREYQDRFPEHIEVIDRVFREASQIVRDGHRLALDVPEGDGPTDRPQSIGKFQVVKLLGQGGFGSVYQGYDPKLDRTVAIKVPHSRQLNAAEGERFLREGRSAARLKHPGIVPVYEIGHQDDLPYIVTEFIEGSTLDDWRRATQPTFRQAAELVARIADALDYAHRQKVIHRDVKPGNILIDDSGQPHLTDFGLARRDGADVTLTLDGQILGTPAYMSPEQACGSKDKMDARADIYSLGVVLYEMLTGDLPFQGNARTLLQQAVHATPRPLRQVNQEIPHDLEGIVLRCLAKEPDQRYATAAELAEDLRGWLRCQASGAPRSRNAYPRGRWRRKMLALAGLATAVGTLCFLVPMVIPVSLWGTTRGEEIGQPVLQPLAPDGLLDVAGPPAAEEPQDASLAKPEPSSLATIPERKPQVQLVDDSEGNVSTAAVALDAAEQTRRNIKREHALSSADDERGKEPYPLWLVNETGAALVPYPVVVEPDGGHTRVADADHTVEAGQTVRIDTAGFNPVFYDPESQNGFMLQIDRRGGRVLAVVFRYQVPPGQAGKDPTLQPEKLGQDFFPTDPLAPNGLIVTRGWSLESFEVEERGDASRATLKVSSPASATESGPHVQVIDDFEGDAKPWAAFLDGAEETQLTFKREQAMGHSGGACFAVRYDVGPGNWATCSLVCDRPQDWSDFQGLSLYLRAERVGQPVTIVAYGGESRDDLMHFEYHLEAGQRAVTGWQRLDIPWEDLAQPQWQGDGTAKFNPRASMGIAFAFDGPESGRNAGQLWVDDITLVSAGTGPATGNSQTLPLDVRLGTAAAEASPLFSRQS